MIRHRLNLAAAAAVAFILTAATAIHAQSPAFEWARGPYGLPNLPSIQGVGRSYATCVAPDAKGNVYTTGNCYGVIDFDPGPAYDSTSYYSKGSGFLIKYDSLGNLVWRRNTVGITRLSMTVDDSGNVIQSGTFYDTVTFGTGSAAVTLMTTGHDMFVAKYTAQGILRWVRSATLMTTGCGACQFIYGSLTADHAGNIYKCGAYTSASTMPIDFDKANPGTVTLNGITRNQDAYLVKYDGNGTAQWARQVSGGDGEAIYRVAISPVSGNVVAGGYVSGGDLFFPPAAPVYNSLGASDAFVASYTPAGSFLWAKRLGTANYDFANDLQIDKQGNIVANGFSYIDPQQTKSAAFITKMNDTGAILWNKTFAGHLPTAKSVALDDSDNMYLVGTFDSTLDLNPGGAPGAILTSRSRFDMFLLKLRANGNYVWSKSFTGLPSEYVEPYWVSADKAFNIYASGVFLDTCNFNPGFANGKLAGNNRINSHTQAGFVVKFSQGRKPLNVLVPEVAGLQAIIAYPNPAYDMLAIQGLQQNRPYRFTVTDMLGRHYSVYPAFSANGQAQLPLRGLPPGCYVLSCRDEAGGACHQVRFVKSEN